MRRKGCCGCYAAAIHWQSVLTRRLCDFVPVSASSTLSAFRDLRGSLVFLGTGTSVGVPMVGCSCRTCQSSDPRDHRTRTSVALGLPGGTLLIDTTPDLREQLLRERIGTVDAVLYTHDHVDHVYGMDDLRPICFHRGAAVPVYCEERVERRILKAFDYAFAPPVSPGGGLPKVTFIRIADAPFALLGTEVMPLRLQHGRFEVLGFRFGNVAYCTDTNHIPAETWPRLQGLDVLILDCLRASRHPTHFSLDEALEVVDRVKPKRTLLVHMSHDLCHADVAPTLPAGVELAYDGLVVPLGL